jgi:hypothetical protein
MRRRLPIILAVLAVGVLGVVALSLDGQRKEEPPVEVVFGQDNGVPDEILEGEEYVAAFQIEWTGPVTMRDGKVNVFQSRTGDTTEDAPDENWPLVCTSEFDDVKFRQRVTCPFTAPGPGEFALQLVVLDAAEVTIGDALYSHLVIDPTATTAP